MRSFEHKQFLCVVVCIVFATMPILCNGFKLIDNNNMHLSSKIFINSVHRRRLIKRVLDKTVQVYGGSNTPGEQNSSSESSTQTILSESITKNSSNSSLLHNIFNLFTSTESFFSKWVSSFASDPDIVNLIAKVCSCAFWTYVTMCILGTVGIDTKPFLTFLNVALITLGFAAKDLITHSFAGIFILFNRPFSRGDLVRIGGFRGHVTSIDIRYVKLSEPTDGSEILIPLSMVYNGPIVIEKHGNKSL